MHIYSSRIMILSYILLGCLVVACVVGLLRRQPRELIQGQTDATDYCISSKVPTRVKEIRVKKGMRVHRGDTLVILDAPNLVAKRNQAQAASDAAQAMANKAEDGTREEMKRMAFQQLQQAKAGLTIAEQTWTRMEALYREGVIPEQRLDEARAQRDAARATERAASAQYDMAINGSRAEDKAAAQARHRQASGAVEEVDSYLDETILTAPDDGWVTEIYVEKGEVVGSGAHIMDVDTDDKWFTFNVREDLLPGIKMGKEMDVYVPSLGRNVRSRVSMMKNVGDFVTWKATRALDRLDFHVFEVQLRPLHPEPDLRKDVSAVLQTDN